MSKVCSKCEVEKPLGEFAKNKTKKLGVDSCCLVCKRLSNNKWYKEGAEVIKKKANDYYHANRDHVITRQKAYNKTHQKRKKEWASMTDEQKKDEYAVRRKRYEEDPSGVKASVAMQRARKRKLTHPNHSKEITRELFRIAKRLEVETGEPYEVDHVFPLAAGGPHWHENLQVIPKAINRDKGDSLNFFHPYSKHWTDLPQYVLDAINEDALAYAEKQLSITLI